MPSAADEYVVFVSNSPALALGLDLILPNFAVVCGDDASIVDDLANRGVPVFCLARQKNLASLSRNSNEILAQPEVQEFIHDLAPASVIVFKNSAGIQQICQEQGWRLFASEALTARKFENKLQFPKILEALGLAHPPRLERRAGDLTLEGIHREIGLPAVLQYAKGFSGRETYFISSQAELEVAQAGNENRTAKVTAFIHGPTLTVNACVTPFGILVSDPFLQITGLPNLTRFRLGSCGQDWAFRAASEEALAQIREASTRIGEYFCQQGYRGIFGLDFVVDEARGALYVIETNPRLVASIPVFTDLQLAAGELPLLLWHLQAFGWEGVPGVEFSQESYARAEQELRGPRPGAQLILHNLENYDQVVSGELEAGVYALEGEALRLVRPGTHLLNGPSQGEALVLPAAKGQVVHPGIECARVQFPQSVLAGVDQLTPAAEALCEAVYRRLRLTPVL